MPQLLSPCSRNHKPQNLKPEYARTCALQQELSSVAQLCSTLCNPMNHNTPGLPVYHQLPEPTQTHVHWVGDAIQPSHPLSSPSPPALNLSQHQFSSVAQLCLDSLQPYEPQHTRPPCPSPTSGVHPNSRPLSQWCHLTISSSVVSFSSCLQSFPTSGSFQMSQLFTSGNQNIGVPASTSVLPMNTQDWSPLGWTGWISLQSKGLTRVFSNTTIQKHQFFCAQLSL